VAETTYLLPNQTYKKAKSSPISGKKPPPNIMFSAQRIVFSYPLYAVSCIESTIGWGYLCGGLIGLRTLVPVLPLLVGGGGAGGAGRFGSRSSGRRLLPELG
jgi:hypothetical protein